MDKKAIDEMYVELSDFLIEHYGDLQKITDNRKILLPCEIKLRWKKGLSPMVISTKMHLGKYQCVIFGAMYGKWEYVEVFRVTRDVTNKKVSRGIYLEVKSPFIRPDATVHGKKFRYKKFYPFYDKQFEDHLTDDIMQVIEEIVHHYKAGKKISYKEIIYKEEENDS